MISHEGGMNPVAMTIINPWKEIGWALDQTSNPQFSSLVRYQLSYRDLAYRIPTGPKCGFQNIHRVLSTIRPENIVFHPIFPIFSLI